MKSVDAARTALDAMEESASVVADSVIRSFAVVPGILSAARRLVSVADAVRRRAFQSGVRFCKVEPTHETHA